MTIHGEIRHASFRIAKDLAVRPKALAMSMLGGMRCTKQGFQRRRIHSAPRPVQAAAPGGAARGHVSIVGVRGVFDWSVYLQHPYRIAEPFQHARLSRHRGNLPRHRPFP